MFIYVSIATQMANRLIDRQAYRHTDRQTAIMTDIDRQTDRH